MPTATAIAKLPSAVAISALAQPSNSPRVPSKSRKATNSGASASSSAAAMRTIAKEAMVETRKMTRAKPRAKLSKPRKGGGATDGISGRSEERRVGKECGSKFRSRWSPDQSQKKQAHESEEQQ